MKKLLLVDGHSILNRAYYGLPPLTSPDGTPIGAVYGFLNILLRFVKEENPAYLAVAFDLSTPTFRHKMYSEYKGTRKSMDDDLRVQVPIIKEVLKAMDIVIITKEGYEADDIIGTIAKKNASKELEVTILSGDKDLLQLADSHISMKTPKTSKGVTTVTHYTPEKISEEFGVTPDEFVLYKAIVGDTSDNIPGVKGVGPKTAAPIVSKYQTLENVIEHIDELGSPSVKKKMQEGIEDMRLSFMLAQIDTEAPVEFDLKDAEIRNFYNANSYDIFKKYNFKNMLASFAKEESNQPLKLPEIKEIIKFADIAEVKEKVSDNFSKEKPLGISISRVEKNNDIISFLNGSYPDSLAIATDKNTVYYICLGEDIEGKDIEKLFFETVGIFDSDKAADIYINDIKNKSKVFESFKNFPFDKFKDVSVAAYLKNPLKGSYLYDEIAADILEMTIPGVRELKDDKDSDKLSCAYDAFIALVCGEKLFNEMSGCEVLELYEEIEKPLIEILADMEETGVRVARNELKAYSESLSEGINKLKSAVYEEAGEEFNILSPKVLGNILFEKLGLPHGKKTKTGYSTAAEVLEGLAPKYKIAGDILEYRTLTKLKSTYADGLCAFIEDDGRIHGSFNQTVTSTGRLSSTNPNLQNIPIRMELGKRIRKVFIPKDGFVFLDADYSQIELRVLAHMSGDKKLIEAYNQAKDIHTMTASQVFHVPFEEVTEEQRRNAKAVNFGIIYGISSFGLGKDLSISPGEAKEYINSYFQTYPGIKEFLDNLVSVARDKGYSETLFGRRRPIPEINAKNAITRQFGERVAMNAPIQGTAADIMKLAMIRLYNAMSEEGLKSKLIIQVHDEILVEVFAPEKERVAQLITDSMMNAVSFRVPLEIEINEGKNWFEAH